MTMPVLIFYRQGLETLRFPLQGDLKIGRHPSNDLTLPDEEVSRFHSLIEQVDGTYRILDKSRNGTFVNGKRVAQSPLKEGDEISIGNWKIMFQGEIGDGEKETAIQKVSKPGHRFCGIVGESSAIQRVFTLIEKAAPTSATVLISGETGTGKELVARAIHELSPRARKPLVPINCGAISSQLIESELFGHERGAFTGALNRHLGAFEQAQGGTLFLDEVGEIPLDLQPKLLRVLEEKSFRRVGGTQEIHSDVRIIAATHRNLEQLSREGKFREDLYFRLFTLPIPLPPLRERAEDVPLLMNYFLSILGGNTEGSGKKFSPEAIQKLVNHPWRGNVRELKNVITRSLLFSSSEIISPQDILFMTAEMVEDRSNLESVEKQAILTALKENDWNKKETASALGIAKSTLFNKLKEYQIKKE